MKVGTAAGLTLITTLLGLQSALIAQEPARVSAVGHDVRLIRTHSQSLAKTGEAIAVGVAVTTGVKSRAELTFSPQSIVRLNSASSLLVKGIREAGLPSGVVLSDVAAGESPITIDAAGIAAEISNSTVVLEHRSNFFKFLVLAGTGRIYRPNNLGDSVLVQAGQMVFGRVDAPLSDPVDFDISRFVQTSALITKFRPLWSNGAISAAIRQQQRDKTEKKLVETNIAILGGGSTVSLVNQARAKR